MLFTCIDMFSMLMVIINIKYTLFEDNKIHYVTCAYDKIEHAEHAGATIKYAMCTYDTIKYTCVHTKL